MPSEQAQKPAKRKKPDRLSFFYRVCITDNGQMSHHYTACNLDELIIALLNYKAVSSITVEKIYTRDPFISQKNTSQGKFLPNRTYLIFSWAGETDLETALRAAYLK